MTDISERYSFKIANKEEEFKQIFELNHRTFADEIPQHERRDDGRLVDKFHEENIYFICKHEGQVVGMMSCRGKRPFSLDSKIDNLDEILDEGSSPTEIRLLAVEPEHRGTRVLLGLGLLMMQTARAMGHDCIVISGTTLQLRLYKKIGFTPFGDLVGKEGAEFQPMILRLEQQAEQFKALSRICPPEFVAAMQTNLLPGPVTMKQNVIDAFARTPISHRSDNFVTDFNAVRQSLSKMVNAVHTSLFLGSGTLANDVVAGQIKLRKKRGLILKNGEFGGRLVDHATRMGLEFDVIEKDWGEAIGRDDIEKVDLAQIDWLWTTHCETSSGIMYDLDMLKEICRGNDIALCLDAISSIGAVDVDLSGVTLASCTSGKALQSFSGLAIVYHDYVPEMSQELPRYLDLGKYFHADGIAYTQNSNLVYALREAVKNQRNKQRLPERHALAARLRADLQEKGLRPLIAEKECNPLVVTLEVPTGISSLDIADKAEAAGFLLSARSRYLVQRNWIQICLMGELDQNAVGPIVPVLAKALTNATKRAA